MTDALMIAHPALAGDALFDTDTPDGADHFRLLAETMPALVFVADANGRNLYTNVRYQAFTGRSAEELAGNGWAAVVHSEDLPEVVRGSSAALAAGDSFECEIRLRRSDGAWRWFLVRSASLGDERGRPSRWIGTLTDIDDKKRQEAELREALEVKDVLLKEVNHRVKNSLQLVTSLLALEAKRIADPVARQTMLDARGRVAVVADIHQRLYSTSQHDRVDFASYLRELAESTLAVLDTEGRLGLAFRDDGELVLPLNQAVPLALVASELVTNAVKYAFPGQRRGTVNIEVGRVDETRAALVVADDGQGLPSDFAPARSSGLGMRIVAALTRQIRGRLDVEHRSPGAAFRIELPILA